MYDTDNLTKDEAEYLASYINDDIFLDCIYLKSEKQIEEQQIEKEKYFINEIDFCKEEYYVIVLNYDYVNDQDNEKIAIDIVPLRTWFEKEWLYLFEYTDKNDFLNMFENSY